MIRLGASLIAISMGTTAFGETCVGPNFDRPFPNATQVQTRLADVPSPRFPGIWQEGQIEGLFYQIWSNNEAVLRADSRGTGWAISVICEGDTENCARSVDGTPPEAALRIANDLEACLTNAEFDGPAPVEETPEPVEEVAVAEPVEPAAPCGLAALPEGSTGLTLQRLIVEAGGDPGPLDGLPGNQTRAALIDVLGDGASGMSDDQAIAALDEALCAQSQ